MPCAICSVSGVGIIASSQKCTVHPDQPAQTRPVGWDTGPSKVCWLYIIFMLFGFPSHWTKIENSQLTHYFPSGFVIFRIRIRRGGRKRPVPKGCTYGKPKSHGVNQLKPTRNLQAMAEVFNFCLAYYLLLANLRVKLLLKLIKSNNYGSKILKTIKLCGFDILSWRYTLVI